MNFSKYTIKTEKEVLEIFKTGEAGLSQSEVERRQQKHGFNEIKTKEVRTSEILKRQFKSAFFYLLFFTAFIALFIGEIVNGILILLFALINVFLGFFQEYRAERTNRFLKKYFSQETRVIRGGEEKNIDKKLLVPGDIALIEAGNIVPADVRIIKEKNLVVDESAFTGESEPQVKTSEPLLTEAEDIFQAKNIVFAGTSIVSGETEGVVINTGKNTAFGEIVNLTAETKRQSVYEKNLMSFSNLILRIVLITLSVIFVSNLIIKGPANLSELLIFYIALIVGIIPEALPVVVTFALSQGALRMARKKVVVRRLSSIEDLGNIEILCTDKTGTLTENKLTVETVFSQDKEKCLLYGLLSSSYMAEEIESQKNPFDAAIFEKSSEGIKNNLNKYKVISEIPFDAVRLRTSTLLECPEGKFLIVKGAPEVILKLSSKKEIDKGIDETKKEIIKEGRQGKRVLGIAFKKLEKTEYSENDENDLTFLGYFSFTDPLKKTAKSAIKSAKDLGIQIKILTGDGPEVAGQVAKEIGLIRNFKGIISGKELNSLSKEEFEKKCFEFKVFARVSPETKFRIIETLQKKFEVGFLGEGINDAPALKLANVAIAVKGASDVSREASDIIMIEKDLRVIIDGVKEGRNVFSNVNKYIKCTLASNFGNFYSIAAISLIIPFLPMLPVQILLANLLTDFPLIAVASDKIDAEEFKKPKLFQLQKLIFLIFILGLTSSIFDFIFFGLFNGKVEPPTLQTLWFVYTTFTELALIFSVRTSHFFLKAKKPSPFLIYLTVLTFVVTLLLPFTKIGQEFFHFSPLPFSYLLILVLLAFVYLFASEIVKLTYFNHQNKKNAQAA